METDLRSLHVGFGWLPAPPPPPSTAAAGVSEPSDRCRPSTSEYEKEYSGCHIIPGGWRERRRAHIWGSTGNETHSKHTRSKYTILKRVTVFNSMGEADTYTEEVKQKRCPLFRQKVVLCGVAAHNTGPEGTQNTRVHNKDLLWKHCLEREHRKGCDLWPQQLLLFCFIEDDSLVNVDTLCDVGRSRHIRST